MAPPSVVDTNVLVSGLLASGPDSATAKIVDAMLSAAFPFVLSDALMAEYRSVLLRPALIKAHGLGPGEIDVVLVELAQHAMVLSPRAAGAAPDPGDQHLWDLLAARDDLVLITGDKLLQRNRAMRRRILTPAEFAERWLVPGRWSR